MLYAGLINDLQGDAERAFFDLEVVTKNINNINTPGYKAERTFSFDQTLSDTASESQYPVQKYMEPGKLSITNDPNEVSLEGKGFFSLTDEKGRAVFARNLTLSQDKDGNLVSGETIVCPKTDVPKGFTGYDVTPEGIIYGKKADGTKIKVVKLTVVNFPAAEKLEFDGMLYRPTAEAGKPLTVCTGPLEQTKVRQYAQESSNVEAPLEFSRFADVNRKISTIAKLNQLLNTSEREYIRTLTSIVQ
jgi:flagellar basal-body rod protein FlgG